MIQRKKLQRSWRKRRTSKISSHVSKNVSEQLPPSAKLDGEERVLIMKTLMSLRGKGTKKHGDAQAKGKLMVKMAPLRYSHVIDPVEDLVGRLQTLTTTSAAILHKDEDPKQLERIFCPKCMESKSTRGLKIKAKTSFSNIQRGFCTEAPNGKLWSCECGVCWRKCEKHLLIKAAAISNTKGIQKLKK